MQRQASTRPARNRTLRSSVRTRQELGSGLDGVLRSPEEAVVPDVLLIQRGARAAVAGRVLLALALLVAVGFIALLIAVSRVY